jgi:hypothetical protein
MLHIVTPSSGGVSRCRAAARIHTRVTAHAREDSHAVLASCVGPAIQPDAAHGEIGRDITMHLKVEPGYWAAIA